MKQGHLIFRRGWTGYATLGTALFVAAVLLAACGGQSTPSEEPAAPALPPAAVSEPEPLPEPAAEPVTQAPAAVIDDGPVEDEDPDAFAEEMIAQMERDAAQAALGVTPTLPDDFPQDIPLPEDHTLSGVSEGEASTTVQAASLMALDDLNAHFLQSMNAQGWTVAEQGQDGGAYEQIRSIVFEKEGRTVSVNLIATNRLPHQQIVVTLHHE